MSKYTILNPTPFETHMLVYGMIEEGSKVLDVGCATGYIAQKLKEKNCKIWGAEIDKEAARTAKRYCEDIVIADLGKIKKLPFNNNFFDYILLLDVLEHLKSPDYLLELIKPHLKKNGKIIISVPNIAFISIRIALLLGRFDYKEMGIMDETHLRFFTQKTFLELMAKSNLKLLELDFSSGFSQITKIGKYLNHIPKYWQYQISKFWPTLLAYQFIAVVTIY